MLLSSQRGPFSSMQSYQNGQFITMNSSPFSTQPILVIKMIAYKQILVLDLQPYIYIRFITKTLPNNEKKCAEQ